MKRHEHTLCCPHVRRPADADPVGHVGATESGQPVEPCRRLSALAGRWQADPPFKEAEGPKPRFVNTLVIGVTAQEITIDRGYSPTERYRLDGTPTFTPMSIA
jgi:hypothetical protein